MRIYLASSWRNLYYPKILKFLQDEKFDVYDFRNLESHFKWADIDPNWENWDMKTYRDKLNHPLAKKGYNKDLDALLNADVCILILPCGRSAHLELGMAIANDLRTIIYIPEKIEPELMYKAADFICISPEELIARLNEIQDEYLEADAWLCSCGHFQEDGLHCDKCGNEPPWGCPCSSCEYPE